MQLIYRGSVNQWECDENQHLNVRYFLTRHQQILQGGLLQAGLCDPSNAAQLANTVTLQHLRFIQEARLAEPLSGYFGWAQTEAGGPRIVTEIRHSHTDEVMCSCVHEIALDQLHPDPPNLQPWQGSRGVPDNESPYVGCSVDEALGLGFFHIGAGVVQADETCSQGQIALPTYMGRISDAMPHLWQHVRGDDGVDGDGQGGAVLEYRLRYHRLLQVGEIFNIYGGLAAAEGKLQRFVHLIFDVDGKLTVSTQTAGVRLDLVARKAIAMDPDTLARLQPIILRKPSGVAVVS